VDLTDEGTLTVGVVLNGLVVSALAQYTSTAIAMPWEVGKMLLQVQWVPRNADEVEASAQLEEEDGEVRAFASTSGMHQLISWFQ
jgi:fusion and transport protein UGO1